MKVIHTTSAPLLLEVLVRLKLGDQYGLKSVCGEFWTLSSLSTFLGTNEEPEQALQLVRPSTTVRTHGKLPTLLADFR